MTTGVKGQLTLRWIREMERQAFPSAYAEPPLPREYVKRFVRNSTVLNDLMHKVSHDYVGQLIDRTYETACWNRHQLKSFVILDCPLARNGN